MNQFAPIFYGTAALIALVLAIMSKRAPLIRLGLIMASAWGACNIAVLAHGYVNAPILIPTIDATLGLLTLGVGALHQSRVALVVFALFMVIQLVHVFAFQLHTQGSYSYFLALNVLFFLQVVTVGGASAVVILASRRAGSGLRPRPALHRV